MIRDKSPNKKLLDRLRLLLQEETADDTADYGDSFVFMVCLDHSSYSEAEAWLAGTLRGKGRILAGSEFRPRPANPAPAAAKATPPGVGREEKSILWGK